MARLKSCPDTKQEFLGGLLSRAVIQGFNFGSSRVVPWRELPLFSPPFGGLETFPGASGGRLGGASQAAGDHGVEGA